MQAQHWAQRPCDFAFMPLQSNSLEEARRALAGGSPVLIVIQAYQHSFMQYQGGFITLPDQVCALPAVTCSRASHDMLWQQRTTSWNDLMAVPRDAQQEACTTAGVAAMLSLNRGTSGQPGAETWLVMSRGGQSSHGCCTWHYRKE